MERELVACGTCGGADAAALGFGCMGGGAAPVDFERTGFGFTCGGIFLAGGCLDANPADPPKLFISPEVIILKGYDCVKCRKHKTCVSFVHFTQFNQSIS